ncbi:MAG TPA: hypothetical protein VG929_04210 [Actinomycetota bacterium]|nr:hypothetical protein [Actinomycetota bacterium]
MEDLAQRRRGPFIVAAAFAAAIIIAVIALPDPFIRQIERNRPLSNAQAGGAYRLLVLFALIQVVYTGGSVFRVQRLADAREKDPSLARLPKDRVVSSLARNAAALVLFTFIYGIASIAITGQRGGFWLFPVLAVAQGAWYYREIGEVAAWKAHQADHVEHDPDQGRWRTTPPDHCPGITRGLISSGAHNPPAE